MLSEAKSLSLTATVFGSSGLLSKHALPTGYDPRLLQINVTHLLQHTGGWNKELSGDPMFSGLATGASTPWSMAAVFNGSNAIVGGKPASTYQPGIVWNAVRDSLYPPTYSGGLWTFAAQGSSAL